MTILISHLLYSLILLKALGGDVHVALHINSIGSCMSLQPDLFMLETYTATWLNSVHLIIPWSWQGVTDDYKQLLQGKQPLHTYVPAIDVGNFTWSLWLGKRKHKFPTCNSCFTFSQLKRQFAAYDTREFQLDLLLLWRTASVGVTNWALLDPGNIS